MGWTVNCGECDEYYTEYFHLPKDLCQDCKKQKIIKFDYSNRKMETYETYMERVTAVFGIHAVLTREAWHEMHIQRLRNIENARSCKKKDSDCENCSG